VLETPHLILRPFEDSDVEAAHLWFSDPEVFRFYTYGPYHSLEETAEHIRQYRIHYAKHGFGKCVVVERATGTSIGDAGLSVSEDTGEIYVGYKLARSHWGRGLATEAALAWINYGFNQLAATRIGAFVHPQNAASIRVIQKLEFAFCRHAREAGIDWNVYELVRPRTADR
jgi:[ribosomal protein S5]-alanine N-acetyltransferase